MLVLLRQRRLPGRIRAVGRAEQDATSEATDTDWVCSACGRTESSGAAALSWTSGKEHGRLRRFCAGCSRTNLRAIEGKLDSEFW